MRSAPERLARADGPARRDHRDLPARPGRRPGWTPCSCSTPGPARCPSGTTAQYVLPHSARVLAGLADAGVPRIHFGVGTGELLGAMAEAGADVVGVDWRVPLDEAAAAGRRPPRRCRATWTRPCCSPTRRRSRPRCGASSPRAARAPGHVFNLGHGVLPGHRPGRAHPARRAGAQPAPWPWTAGPRGRRRRWRDLRAGRRAPAAHPARAGAPRSPCWSSATGSAACCAPSTWPGCPSTSAPRRSWPAGPRCPRCSTSWGWPASWCTRPARRRSVRAGGRDRAAARRHPARRADRAARLDGVLSAAGVAAVAAEPRPAAALGARRRRRARRAAARAVRRRAGRPAGRPAARRGLRRPGGRARPARHDARAGRRAGRRRALADRGRRPARAARPPASPASAPASPRPLRRAGVRGVARRLPLLLDALARPRRRHPARRPTVRELDRPPDGWRLVLGPATGTGALDVDAVLLAVPAPAVAPAAGRRSRRRPAAAAAEIELASSAVVALAYRRGRRGDAAADVRRAGRGRRAAGGQGRHPLERASGRTCAAGRAGPAARLARPVRRGGRRCRSTTPSWSPGSGPTWPTLTGITAEPVAVHVQRWGGGLPQYARRAPRPGARRSSDGAGRAGPGRRRGGAARRRRAGLRRHRPGRRGAAGRPARRPRPRHGGRAAAGMAAWSAWPASTTPS